MATKNKGTGDRKVSKVMHEFKEGDLRSRSGQKVTNRKQAIAIALSEAREAGAPIPERPSAKHAKKRR
jgi:hypothetical protein